jgi:hypothetical protein
MYEPSAEDEARVFAKYLIGCDVDDECAQLYARAAGELGSGQELRDRKILTFALRHAWALGPLDAISALRRPKSILRAKLLLMSAILEAHPGFSEKFLPADHSGMERAALLYYACRAVARAIAGFALLAAIA